MTLSNTVVHKTCQQFYSRVSQTETKRKLVCSRRTTSGFLTSWTCSTLQTDKFTLKNKMSKMVPKVTTLFLRRGLRKILKSSKCCLTSTDRIVDFWFMTMLLPVQWRLFKNPLINQLQPIDHPRDNPMTILYTSGGTCMYCDNL